LGEQYNVKPSPKMLELYRKFSEAKKKDEEKGTWDNLFGFVSDRLHDCVNEVEHGYSVEVPPLQLKLCTDAQFKEAQQIFPGARGATTGFIEHIRGLVFINLEKLLTECNTESFIANLILTITEELVHGAFPLQGEVETKHKLHSLVEDRFGIPIPEEYKRMSMERARQEDKERLTRKREIWP
jgi:hypothetical protein